MGSARLRRTAPTQLLVPVAVLATAGGCVLVAGLDDHVGPGDASISDGSTADAPPAEGAPPDDASGATCSPLALGAHAHGEVDETFGSSGIAMYEQRTATAGRAVVDRQGRVVIAATAVTTGTGVATQAAVAGFLSDGSPDPRFGDGMTLIDVPGAAQGSLLGASVDPDDGLALSGSAGASIVPQAGVVVRLRPDGGFETAFGTNGVLVAGLTDAAPADRKAYGNVGIYPDPNDRSMVVAGLLNATGDAGLVLAHYKAAGFTSPIGTTPGETTGFLDGGLFVRALVRINGGAVIVAGAPVGSPYLALLRYTFDGGLDSTFGLGSVLPASDGGGAEAAVDGGGADAAVDDGGDAGTDDLAHRITWPAAAVEDAQGRIVVTGQVQMTKNGRDERAVGVARVLRDGSFDPSFGASGLVTIGISSEFHDEGLAIALDPDGSHLVVAAYTSDEILHPDAATTRGTVALVRLDETGNPDAQFGTGGISVAHFGGDGGPAFYNVVPTQLAWDTCRSRWIVSATVKLVTGNAHVAAIAFHP